MQTPQTTYTGLPSPEMGLKFTIRAYASAPRDGAPTPYWERKPSPHREGDPTPNTYMGPPYHTRKGTPPRSEKASHFPNPTEKPLVPIQKNTRHLQRQSRKAPGFASGMSVNLLLLLQPQLRPAGPWGGQVGPQGEPFKKSRDSQEAAGNFRHAPPPPLAAPHSTSVLKGEK